MTKLQTVSPDAPTVELDPAVIAELEKDLMVVPVTPMNFTYDTSIDSPNYNSDSGAPTAITIHWWGSPGYHRNGLGLGIAQYLSRANGNSSAHYVATVETASREERVWQTIADSDDAWHAGTYAGNKSIGIEMMPFDHMTPAWQVEKLLDLAAQVVASLWHRWPHLKDMPLEGHRDWLMSTECPGTYYSNLDHIRQRAEKFYSLYDGSFGKFRTETSDVQTQEEDMLYVISSPTRGIALVGPGHFAPCTDNIDVGIAIRLSKGNVLETNNPDEWDRWRRLMVGEAAITSLSQGDIDRMTEAVKGISAADVADKLEIGVRE